MTDRKIIDTIPDNKPPQVTFTCSASGAYSNSSTPASSVWPNSLINPLAEGDALGECKFQFWVDRIESFYCNLQGCSWDSKDSFGESTQVGHSTVLTLDSNMTNYRCEKIECSCIPGRFLCGEDGSVST